MNEGPLPRLLSLVFKSLDLFASACRSYIAFESHPTNDRITCSLCVRSLLTEYNTQPYFLRDLLNLASMYHIVFRQWTLGAIVLGLAKAANWGDYVSPSRTNTHLTFHPYISNEISGTGAR
jgi:hypothetical protein